MPRTMQVWVDGWQQQCCGEPFGVGDVVTWDVTAPDAGHVERLFGDGHDVEVTWVEEHHGGGSKVVAGKVTGRVGRIRGVTVRFEARPGGRNSFAMVPGSGRLEPVHGPVGREGGFVAYLVSLERAEQLPLTP